jgi:hypothetical protein
MGPSWRKSPRVWGAARDANHEHIHTQNENQDEVSHRRDDREHRRMAYNYISNVHENPERGSNPLVWRGNPPGPALGEHRAPGELTRATGG